MLQSWGAMPSISIDSLPPDISTSFAPTLPCAEGETPSESSDDPDAATVNWAISRVGRANAAKRINRINQLNRWFNQLDG